MYSKKKSVELKVQETLYSAGAQMGLVPSFKVLGMCEILWLDAICWAAKNNFHSNREQRV